MFKFKPIIIALAMTSQLSVAAQFGDWNSYSSSETGEITCLAETSTFVNDIKMTFRLMFPKDGQTLPKISIISKSKNLENFNLKAFNIVTDQSQNPSINLYGSQPLIVDSDNDSQEFIAPLWKTMTLLSDLIKHNSIDVIISQDNENPIQSFIFSLIGSSKTIQAMIKDCLEIEEFKNPFAINDLLNSTMVSYLQKINDMSSLNSIDLNQITVNEFWKKSNSINNEMQVAYSTHLDLINIQNDDLINQQLISHLEKQLAGAKQRLENLLTEKENILQDNANMPSELNAIDSEIEKDEEQLPGLNSIYQAAKSALESVQQSSQEVDQIMDDYNNDVYLFTSNLEKAKFQLEDEQASVEIAKIEVKQVEGEIDDLLNNFNINKLKTRLSERQDELSVILDSLNGPSPERVISRQLRNNSKYTSSVDKLDSIQSDINSIKNLVILKQKDRRELRGQLQVSKASRDSTKQQLADTDGSNAKLNNEKTANLAQNNQINAQIKEIKALEKQAKDEFNANCASGYRENQKTYCEGLAQTKETTKVQITNLDNQAKQLIARREVIESELASNEILKSTLPSTISDKQSEIDGLETKIANLKNSVEELQSEARLFKGQAHQIADRIENIKSKVSEKVYNRYNKLVSHRDSLEVIVFELTGEVNNYYANINELNDMQADLNSEIEQLSSNINQLSIDISNINDDLNLAITKRNEFANSELYKEARNKVRSAQQKNNSALSNYRKTNQRLITNKYRAQILDETLTAHQVRLPELPLEIEREEEMILVTDINLYKAIEAQSQTSEKSSTVLVEANFLIKSIVDDISTLNENL